VPVNRTKPRPGVLYLGPHPDDPDTRLALRGRANLAMKFTDSGLAWWRCPYCGARAKWKPRAGCSKNVALAHEGWCAVPTNAELLAAPQNAPGRPRSE
jgi:DNA-directed RNA polymerase subunit RPC12/RpoP